ncbi:MAG: LolA family protein [Bryobacteraceae bacterium]
MRTPLHKVGQTIVFCRLPLVIAACLAGAGLLPAQSVTSILARMDRAAPQFHALTANVVMDTYTAILSDTTTEHGKLSMQRNGDRVRAILDFSHQPDPKVIAVSGDVVQILYPNLKLVQEFNFGKKTGVLNQYLLLGFGSSGTDLAQSYSITLGGTASVAGRQTTEMVLVPKDPKVRQRLKEVDMWVPNDAAYPVRQKFLQPTGDFRQTTYTGVELNPPIHGELKLKLPPGTKRQSGK